MKRAYPVLSRGQEALLALPDSLAAIARVCGCSKPAVLRWRRGEAAPEPPRDERLEQHFGIARGLWRVGLNGEHRQPGQRTLADELRDRPPAEPLPTVEASIELLLAGDTLSPAERQQAISLRLRQHDAEIEAALDELTTTDRVICHAGFVAMRRTLLELLEGEPEHAAALEAMPEPDAAGPVARLRAVRAALEKLKAVCDASAAQLISINAIQRANQMHAHTARAEKLLQKARLTANPKELFASDTWRHCVAKLSNVLRDSPDALEACQRALEPSPEPFAQRMLAELRDVRFITWPCVRFQDDVRGFFDRILGIELWNKQVEMVEGVRDNEFFACASGRRIGKSAVLAGLALWFYCSFPEARVFIFAPTDHQLQNIVWRELRLRLASSGVCVACRKANADRPHHEQVKAPCPHSATIDGVLAQRATGGLLAGDREIKGVTARSLETAAGLAGRNMLFLGEEASGLLQTIIDAIKGNMAGGGRLALFGNPTRNEGEFYDAFYKKGSAYKTMRVKSTDSPNVVADEELIPGIATRKWCKAREREWGVDSALYKVHVLGEHALGEDGRLIPISLITEANERWFDVEEDGELYIGLDPAGASGLGDDTGFAARRGKRILEVGARNALDDDGQLALVLELIVRHGRKGETALVNVDNDGAGAATLARLQQYVGSNPGVFSAHGVKGSHNAQREPQVYDRVRDELGAFFARWMRAGGAVPEDVMLAAEMHALEMKAKLVGNKGERAKLTAKEVIRKALNRSPDRYDACALSCWEQRPDDMAPRVEEHPGVSAERLGHGGIDPYAGGATGGAIDPYA